MPIEITARKYNILDAALINRRERVLQMIDIFKDDPEAIALYEQELVEIEELRVELFYSFTPSKK